MDTTINGAISGIYGALASIIPGLLARRVFKIAKLNFLDYSGVLVIGHSVNNIGEWLISAFGHIVFGAFLGVVFAYFIEMTHKESLIIKGIGYGSLVWLSTLAFGSFFKLPHFKVTSPSDCLFILIDAIVYGGVLAFSYKKLIRNSWQ